MPSVSVAVPANFKLPMEAHGTVKGLQIFLNDNGASPKLVVDGKMGPKTYGAWLAYINPLWKEKMSTGYESWGEAQAKKDALQRKGTGGGVIVDHFGSDAPAAPEPIWKKPLFWAGVGGFVLLIMFVTRKKGR